MKIMDETTDGTTNRHVADRIVMQRHDRDLILELARRLRAWRRCDRHIATTIEHPHLRAYWAAVRSDERQHVAALKELIAGEVRRGCF